MPVLRACVWCGKEFQPSRSDGLFHSASCKQAYWRWKHKLNLLYHNIYSAITEIEAYLEHKNTRNEAENVLGEVANRLADIGFVASVKQMSLTAEVFVLSNQLGVEENE